MGIVVVEKIICWQEAHPGQGSLGTLNE